MSLKAVAGLEELERRIVLSAAASSLIEVGLPGRTFPSAIATDAQGNYYVAGGFDGVVDFNPKRNRTYLIDGGTSSSFLARYSPSGGLYWVVSFRYASGQTGAAQITSLATDDRGDVYAAGSFQGGPTRDRASGTLTLPAPSDTEPSSTLWKFHRDGSFSFANEVSPFDGDSISASHVAMDRYGSIYTTDYVVTNTSNGNFTTRCYLTKMTSSGKQVWSQPFVDNTYPSTLEIDRHDNPWAAAVHYFGEDHPAVLLATKFNGRGRFQDDIPIATGVINSDVHITFDSEDNLVAAGSFNGQCDFDPGADKRILGPKDPRDGNLSMFLSKITPEHTLLFAELIGGRGNEGAAGVSVDATGVIQVAGAFAGVTDFDPSREGETLLDSGDPGREDLFSATYDHAGRFISVHSLARPERREIVMGVAFARGGPVVLAESDLSDERRSFVVWQ
jgi:hypothetical protein